MIGCHVTDWIHLTHTVPTLCICITIHMSSLAVCRHSGEARGYMYMYMYVLTMVHVHSACIFTVDTVCASLACEGGWCGRERGAGRVQTTISAPRLADC